MSVRGRSATDSSDASVSTISDFIEERSRAARDVMSIETMQLRCLLAPLVNRHRN